MTLISIASTLAIVLAISATLPHIRMMVVNRSSNGQSATGWLLGITVNLLTGYVNLFGVHAVPLGIGNLLTCTCSIVALACVMRFRDRAAAAVPAPSAAASSLAVHELPTGELHLIKALVDAEHERREAFRARAAAEERAAAREDVPEPVVARQAELQAVPA